MGFWRYPADRRTDKIKGEKISFWILRFPLQVPARSAGRITAQGQERRLPCCCAPGCPVSPGRSRSSTRTEVSIGETGTGGRRPQAAWRKGEDSDCGLHQYSTSGTKDNKSLWCSAHHGTLFIWQLQGLFHNAAHTHGFENWFFS